MSSSAPAWVWDERRNSYYYWSEEERAWVYQDGTRIPHNTEGQTSASSLTSTPYVQLDLSVRIIDLLMSSIEDTIHELLVILDIRNLANTLAETASQIQAVEAATTQIQVEEVAITQLTIMLKSTP